MRLRTVILTLPVVALLTQPLWAPQFGAGILGEVAALGPVGASIAVVVFFGLVALYVLTLRRLLLALRPDTWPRTPRSLWLMFAIPLNFVEDIEIVGDLARGMRRDGVLPVTAVRVWHAVGIAWCVLQIASLLPGPAGLAGGAGALVLWVGHWAHTTHLIRRRRTAD